MVTVKQFEDSRNAEYIKNKEKGWITTEKITHCVYCEYQPSSYMDWVKHRESVHGIPRGEADKL